MSISIRLDENQRSLLQLALEIARDKFKENVQELRLNTTSNKVMASLAEQFQEQANEADKLLLWIAQADNVIIEEPND
jgi:hypothetical protein